MALIRIWFCNGIPARQLALTFCSGTQIIGTGFQVEGLETQFFQSQMLAFTFPGQMFTVDIAPATGILAAKGVLQSRVLVWWQPDLCAPQCRRVTQYPMSITDGRAWKCYMAIHIIIAWFWGPATRVPNPYGLLVWSTKHPFFQGVKPLECNSEGVSEIEGVVKLGVRVKKF